MNDSIHSLSDCGGVGPGRRPRGNRKSSDERDNYTARTLQCSASSCTVCGLPIEKGRKPKSAEEYNTTCSMHGAIHTRLTSPVENICLPLARNVAPGVPERHKVLGSPLQSVPMQRGRAYYAPPSGQPPSTAGLTVTAGPTASLDDEVGESVSGSDNAPIHSLRQIPATQLLHPVPRHLNGISDGFPDRHEDRGENNGASPVTSAGLPSLPNFTSFLRHSISNTMAFDPNYASKLPPILSYRRSSSKGSPQAGLINTFTNRSEHQDKEANKLLPPRNPFTSSISGSPTKFPVASLPKDA